MHRAIVILFLCFSCLAHTGCAQSKPTRGTAATTTSSNDSSGLDFSLHKVIPGRYINFEIDVLDNIYLLTEAKQLKKLDPNGDSVAVFNEVTKYGSPSLIDVTNPLKILVYYKNFSTVVILDRLLARRNIINFREKNIFSVKAIATSYDNNIWLFDEQDLKLKKIDDDGKVLQETTDWRLLFNPAPSPVRIIDNESFVYLYDPFMGLYVFDYYGSLKSHLPFTSWQQVAVSGSRVFGFTNNILQVYDTKSMTQKTWSIPASFAPYSDVKAMNGKVYLLKDNALEIYIAR